jgi:hypothetical protein
VNDHSAAAHFYNVNLCHEAKKALDNRPGPFSISRIIKPESSEPGEVPSGKKHFTNSKRGGHADCEEEEKQEESVEIESENPEISEKSEEANPDPVILQPENAALVAEAAEQVQADPAPPQE